MPGYKRFFIHSVRTCQLAALRRAGQAPERLMQVIQAAEAKERPKVGRNDSCPCGSGQVQAMLPAGLMACAF